MECEFCKKILSSLKSLKSHQQKTKYCLDIQGKSNIKCKFICDFCNKNFFTKDSVSRHKKVCKKEIEKLYIEQIEYKIKLEEQEEGYKIKLEKQEEEYKIQIEKLQKIIENIAVKAVSKPNINNIENLTFLDFKETNIQDKVDNFFTIDHLKNGIKGVARFTKDFIINTDDNKLKYICSDVSRGFFKYIDENGVVQKDVKATKLKNSIKEPIINKSKDIFMNENTRIFDEITNTVDCLQLDRLNNNMNVLTEGFIQVKNIDDNINDYSKELVMVL